MRILARLQSRIREASRDIPAADPLRSRGGVGASALAVDEERASLDAAFDSPGGEPSSEDEDVEKEEGVGVEEDPPHDRQIVRLAAEAAVESGRIYMSRAYGTDQREATLRAVAFAHGATRALLGRRAIVLVQFALRDPWGRLIAAHVVPLLVELAGAAARREAVTRVAGWLASHAFALSVADDPARAAWEDASTQTHRQFWQAALTRARAIERAITTAAATPLQQSLFDQRTERERSALAGEGCDFAGELARRCTICENALKAGPACISTVLVLLP
jgi:hypothetical protein